jgi:hypothetical protein
MKNKMKNRIAKINKFINNSAKAINKKEIILLHLKSIDSIRKENCGANTKFKIMSMFKKIKNYTKNLAVLKDSLNFFKIRLSKRILPFNFTKKELLNLRPI